LLGGCKLFGPATGYSSFSAKYFVSNGFATFEHAFVDIRTHFSMALQFFGLASTYMIHFLKINK